MAKQPPMDSMITRRRFVAVLGAVIVFFSTTTSAAPKVVATIMPIHSLAAGVMQGVGAPSLIVRGPASPHNYQLRPSDAVRIGQASIIIWVGEQFEGFLQKPLTTLGHKARLVTLMKAKEINLIPNRKGGEWNHGEHDYNGEHPDDALDAHIWLDPGNTKKIVDVIVGELSAVDPMNAAAYAANGERIKHRIETMDLELAKRLRPVRDRPYVVFHDAYQYLEQYYGLRAVGSVTVSPEQKPSAGRLKALRLKIKELDARCVFSEPQFEPALIKTILEGSTAGRGVLDPLGSMLEPGPNAYFKMMQENVTSIVDCLNN